MKLYPILFSESSYNMSRQPPEDINDKNMMNMDNDHGIYCTGLCGEFAVALSETFGYKLGSIVQVTRDEDYDEDVYTLVHAFAYHPTDKSLGIDAVGIRPIDEMMEDVYVSGEGKLEVQPTSKIALDEQGLEGLDNKAVDDAMRYIAAHKNRYEAGK